ncbi:MAG: tryptophan synthase subunit alpha [Spirochaetes bacterium]|nr:tryptophan synthase subunit alpha [Spirochaetota bacterium]
MKKLMCHLVAGYPTMNLSFQAALGMVEGGASYLEVQFPFSDPTADGPRIQEACVQALDGGFTLREGFLMVRRLSRTIPEIPLFLMSYASLVVRRGISWFLDQAKEAGVQGLIVPDLPFDQDEGYYEAAWERGLHPISVVVPTMDSKRLDQLLGLLQSHGERYIYVALRTGITGDPTNLSDENLSFLNMLAAKELKVLAGFGISSYGQVEALSPYVEAVVVGSYLVGIIRESTTRFGGSSPDQGESLKRAVAKAVSTLIHPV